MWTVLQDLRFSVRQLIKKTGFALAAVTSLALGIGATTAIFSVLYSGLLHPYPYRDAELLVSLTIYSKAEGRRGVNPNPSQIKALRDSPVVERVLTTGFDSMILTGREFPENVAVVGVDGEVFSDLGVPVLLGRGILPSDVTSEALQPVAVLSYRFWRRHFLSDPTVTGRIIQLNHNSYQIVGVASPRFAWANADVYQPLTVTHNSNSTYLVWLRLKPGVSYEAANAALQPVIEQFVRETPVRLPKDFKVKVESLNAWAFRRVGGTVYMMFGAVLALLVIGCGNVSILLLAQGTARQQELAIRATIGAVPGRILRQLLTESLLLAAVGAAVGVWLSYAMLAGIRLLLPPYAFPAEAVIKINLPVLLFSVGVALATGVVFGTWPALQLSRTPAAQTLQSSALRMTASSRRTHNVLIGGQIAMALLLLAASGAAMKEFVHMLHRPLGYDPRNVMSIGIPLRNGSYTTWEARTSYFGQLREKVAQTPGVTTAAISLLSNPPRCGWDGIFEILGMARTEPKETKFLFVSSEYFVTLHIAILRGRVWSTVEDQTAASVAVVNRAFAQRYLANEDPLSRAIKLIMVEDPAILVPPNLVGGTVRIVGVVDDFLNDGLSDPVQPAILVPYTFGLPDGMQILVRSAAPPLTLVNAVKTQLAQVDPDQQTQDNIEELVSWISNGPEWQREHLSAWIFGIFAWLAVALAAIGLYSVVSYGVAQRTSEFGIRMALGAQSGNLLRLVFSSVLGSVGAGILAGLGLSVAFSSVIAKCAQGSVRDPGILLAGVVVLLVVAAMACAIPARRAASIDPMKALRAE
jgi:predicted permease